MPLTEIEKDQVRYFLGYPATLTASSMSFGIPAPIETLFLVNTALNIVKDGQPVENIRRILCVLSGIEQKLIAAQDRLAVESLEGLKLRSTEAGLSEPDALEREYCRWGLRLADILRVPLYVYSDRFRSVIGVSAGSIPVRH